MTTPDIPELWRRYETWLAEHWPAGLDELDPPATDAEIAALETALGVSLPADFVALLRVHDGEPGDTGLFNGVVLLPAGGILGAWTWLKEMLDAGDLDVRDIDRYPSTPGVRRCFWHPRWIPITHDGGGNYDCIDLAPAEGGRVGQIVDVWHETPVRRLRANSFGEWFASYIDRVLAGRYAYSEDYDALVDVDDL